MLELELNKGKKINLEVIDEDNKVKQVELKPKRVIEEEEEVYRYGFSLKEETITGIFPSIKFAFVKTGNLIEQMILVLKSLITGQLKVNSLAGPIGMYGIVDEVADDVISLIYLIAFLSINVGFINLIPFPAFDGGRLLFLIIEKIRRKPINTKVENIIHNIGFSLLILLMLVITYNDIIRLIKK